MVNVFKALAYGVWGMFVASAIVAVLFLLVYMAVEDVSIFDLLGG